MCEHSRAPWYVRYDRFGRAEGVVGPNYIAAQNEIRRIRQEHDEKLRTTRPVLEELFHDPRIPKDVRDDLHPIALTPGATADRRRSANARLISAAPDLLAAARSAYGALRRNCDVGEVRGALLRDLARAISKALGEDFNDHTLVDDRAALCLSPVDRHLPKSQRQYRCKACHREVGTAHDGVCDWLPAEVERCRELWPEAVQ